MITKVFLSFNDLISDAAITCLTNYGLTFKGPQAGLVAMKLQFSLSISLFSLTLAFDTPNLDLLVT